MEKEKEMEREGKERERKGEKGKIGRKEEKIKLH